MDVFHDEVRLSFGCFPRIDESCDVRVIETREDLPFRAETLAQIAVDRGRIDDLDRDLCGVLPIGALSKIYSTCASVTEYRNYAIVIDDAPEERFSSIVRGSLSCGAHGMGQGRGGLPSVDR